MFYAFPKSRIVLENNYSETMVNLLKRQVLFKRLTLL
jgi:hypothetical protein